MQVSTLFCYPIKSCRGSPCQNILIGLNGPIGDRAFMVVDGKDPTQFITQRQEARLALVEPVLTETHLEVAAEGMSPISRHRDSWREGQRVWTKVHKHDCMGVDQGDRFAEWFSDLLHRHTRLLWMPDDHIREPDRLPAGVRAPFKFADGYPLLLASETSLAALNAVLPKDLPPFTMDRFRPNIVVDGTEGDPWAEETWLRFLCGSVHMRGVKLCDRCAIITTDQLTGERMPKLLAALLKAHSGERDGKPVPIFGMNLIPETGGAVHVGDRIKHIEFGSRPAL
jgi:uncharacterized protein YcbX